MASGAGINVSAPQYLASRLGHASTEKLETCVNQLTATVRFPRATQRSDPPLCFGLRNTRALATRLQTSLC